MKINMTEEIYLAPGGTGPSGMRGAPYCALGKIALALGLGEFDDKYTFIKKLGVDIDLIYYINDGCDNSASFREPNHYKALKLCLQMLQESGHEVVLPFPVFNGELVNA